MVVDGWVRRDIVSDRDKEYTPQKHLMQQSFHFHHENQSHEILNDLHESPLEVPVMGLV